MIEKIFNKDRFMFQLRYVLGRTPWDTNITPPEVYDFIKTAAPGRALDLGCGTGTNAITLTRNGWTVTGVDFSSRAIRRANKKAKKAGLKIEFYTADVTALDMLTVPYDYALDIGCLFALDDEKRNEYAITLKRLVKPKGIYMLYAWLPRVWKGKVWGISLEQIEALLAPEFIKRNVVLGEERGFGTAWYWYEKI